MPRISMNAITFRTLRSTCFLCFNNALITIRDNRNRSSFNHSFIFRLLREHKGQYKIRNSDYTRSRHKQHYAGYTGNDCIHFKILGNPATYASKHSVVVAFIQGWRSLRGYLISMFDRSHLVSFQMLQIPALDALRLAPASQHPLSCTRFLCLLFMPLSDTEFF